MKELTVKQEKYCQLRAGGMSRKKACCQSYDTKSTNANSLSVSANELEKNPIVSLRIKELKKLIQEETIDEIIWGRKLASNKMIELARALKEQIESSDYKRPGEVSVLMKCYVEINRLHGLYEGQNNLFGGCTEVVFLNAHDVED